MLFRPLSVSKTAPLPVNQFALSRPKIIRPLVFYMDERPLPAAEGKMLEPGELEIVVLGKAHAMQVQVTPAGRRPSSTLTV